MQILTSKSVLEWNRAKVMHRNLSGYQILLLDKVAMATVTFQNGRKLTFHFISFHSKTNLVTHDYILVLKHFVKFK